MLVFSTLTCCTGLPPSGSGWPEALLPLHRGYLCGHEHRLLGEVLAEGLPANGGRFSTACRKWIEGELGARRVILTTSATAALEMAALLCEIEPGDEVVLPSFTYVATANAFLLRGATLRFGDIRADTLNLDEQALRSLITPRTRVVVPVHYAGVGAATEEMQSMTRPHGIDIVEDAAQGLLASRNGRALGTAGELGVISFHATKNISCGQGGALLVNDPRFDERASILSEEGTDRIRFRQGTVTSYQWHDIGSAFQLSEMAAAMLLAQLQAASFITMRRNEILTSYSKALSPLAQKGLLQLPVVPGNCLSNGHIMYVILPDRETRHRLSGDLRALGIEAVGHFMPLHASPMGQRLGYRSGDLPVTEDLASRLLRLPCWPDLSDVDIERVVNALETCLTAGSD
ncbi:MULTISPECIES: dTDP-4-amino-4,6-dideoxygalactose transaminase [unclassified Synechococcus]|uniref:dTDP-4-amino-4,6-dideoxygalactose transaminase n=1 Tax=unclassified Synechococcus TaxID=2626047 RepID=UPI0020CE38F5|nr:MULTISPECIES: dTDP-4-amino-4,6-dideoxygalactose transaminase [unclassified Synechococcus]